MHRYWVLLSVFALVLLPVCAADSSGDSEGSSDDDGVAWLGLIIGITLIFGIIMLVLLFKLKRVSNRSNESDSRNGISGNIMDGPTYIRESRTSGNISVYGDKTVWNRSDMEMEDRVWPTYARRGITCHKCRGKIPPDRFVCPVCGESARPEPIYHGR